MRKLCSSLALVALLGACGGGDNSPPPATIDGTWNAVSQPAGTSLSLALTTQSGNAVVGAGAYTQAGTTLVLAVAGTYQAPVVALSFNYSDGNTAVYAATASDATHMSGRLSYKDGTSQDLAMVRQ